MPELIAALDAHREQRQLDRQFFAALQGVDLEKDTKDERSHSMMDEIKTIIMTGGQHSDPNDVLSLTGANARAKGFGIGEGLTYADNDAVEWWKE